MARKQFLFVVFADRLHRRHEERGDDQCEERRAVDEVTPGKTGRGEQHARAGRADQRAGIHNHLVEGVGRDEFVGRHHRRNHRGS